MFSRSEEIEYSADIAWTLIKPFVIGERLVQQQVVLPRKGDFTEGATPDQEVVRQEDYSLPET